ncbi:MAG: 5'/3'-nucleotidase SurE [Eubacteriales bacterium]|nr:5'/3'-nucleotidase SurE [Eubacteriales bacterium]
MNILVVNDDGIRAKGIQALAEALTAVGDVYVCAPDSERSGASQSITMDRDIQIADADFPGVVAALETTGTPADCTKVGIQMFGDRGVEFDMVFSGINLGANMGYDILYSGTVGAAREGAISGIRSVAVSVQGHRASHFEFAGKLAVSAAEYSMSKLDHNTLLNINAPDLPEEDVKGVRLAELGERFFQDRFFIRESGGYRMNGGPLTRDDPELRYDISCVNAGYAAVTPVSLDGTHYNAMETMREWEIFR